jgi:hypothetical protein
MAPKNTSASHAGDSRSRKTHDNSNIPNEKKAVKNSKPIVIERQLLESQAYMKLTGKSTQVLALLLLRRKMVQGTGSKRKQWNCVNDGEIVLSYRQAEKRHGISEKQFRNALDQLVRHGLIRIARVGGGYGREPSLYGFSEAYKNFGTEAFKQPTRTKGPRVGKCKARDQIQQP